jgi:hypothetical protein
VLKILRYVFSTITLLFIIYAFITENYESSPFITFFLGLMMLVVGLEEFQKGRKSYGWLGIGGFLYAFFVSIQGF